MFEFGRGLHNLSLMASGKKRTYIEHAMQKDALYGQLCPTSKFGIIDSGQSYDDNEDIQVQLSVPSAEYQPQDADAKPVLYIQINGKVVEQI